MSVKVKRFEHKHDARNPGNIEFYIEFSANNRGNRSTTLNELELSFSDNGKAYTVKVPIEDGYADGLTGGGISKINLEASKTIDRNEFFYNTYYDGIKQVKKSINCHLTIYHTHKAFKFDATSKLVSK